jgi:hypothetical protein
LLTEEPSVSSLPLVIISSPLLIKQFLNKASVAEQAKKKVLQYPPICLQASDLHIEQNHPVCNLILQWVSLFTISSSLLSLEEANRYPHEISMAPMNVCEPGLRVLMQAHLSGMLQPYPDDLRDEKSREGMHHLLHFGKLNAVCFQQERCLFPKLVEPTYWTAGLIPSNCNLFNLANPATQ